MTDNDVRLLAEVEQRTKSNTHQIEEIKDNIKEIKAENKAIHDLTTSVRLIAQDMGTIKETIKKVESGQESLSLKITEIENKPAQETASNWSKIKVAVATSLVTAVVMGMFGAIVYFVR